MLEWAMLAGNRLQLAQIKSCSSYKIYKSDVRSVPTSNASTLEL